MKIHSKVKDYTVEMTCQVLARKSENFSDLNFDRLFYFVDANVAQIYSKELKEFIGEDFCQVIEAKEGNKEYHQLSVYYQALIDQQFTRKDILVTIGGGILQDISGFIASTLYRGIKWVFIPTTLLAQADSCIGSKTSINFKDSKNLIGTFYPPDKILIDQNFCQTLTPEYFNSGLGEIIKFHLLSDEQGYGRLKEYLDGKDLRSGKNFGDIILSTLEVKRSYFEADEFDTGRRNLLNYGHCFGHALESASRFAVCHGEAVIVGMGFANLLSLRRGVLSQEKYDELEALIKSYYPDYDLSQISAEALIGYLKKDKKRVGKDLTMILVQDIGQHIKSDDIKEEEIRETFSEFLKVYHQNRRPEA